MTPDERRAIAARLEAATPGPWYPRWGGEPGYITAAGEPLGEIYAGKTDAHRDPNLDFVCAARRDVPALLAALDAADARVARLRAVVERFVDAEAECDYVYGEPDVCPGIANGIGICRWCEARAALEQP